MLDFVARSRVQRTPQAAGQQMIIWPKTDFVFLRLAVISPNLCSSEPRIARPQSRAKMSTNPLGG
jgi:hypothetical protein